MERVTITERVDHFNLGQIAKSGQTFRWIRQGPQTYTIPAAGDYCTAFMPERDQLKIRCRADMVNFWRRYFGLCDPYPEYWATIDAWAEKDGPEAYLTKAAAHADGMVILRQPTWEAAASFVISQNNNIPRIKSIIEALCRRFGHMITLPSSGWTYTFPEPEKLADVAALGGLGLGYRDKYLAALASAVAGGSVNLEAMTTMDYETAKEALKAIPGIGEKVANCILLYGLGHLEAFPVDVWIRRILEREFPDGFPVSRYAGFAGLVQQIMFYYERESGRPTACT